MTEHRTVPVEPTPEMIEAGWNLSCHELAGANLVKTCYKAMLAAAPQPPNELAELEREFAEAWAREMFPVVCCAIDSYGWFHPEKVNFKRETLAEYLRYFELRGLLERHPTDSNLVKVRLA